MRTGYRWLGSLLLAGAIAAPVMITGCAAHASYRVYDPGYHDYHTWNNGEVVYYNRWENDTHREHREFRERNAREQQEYWNWRHHHERDRDDRDHH